MYEVLVSLLNDLLFDENKLFVCFVMEMEICDLGYISVTAMENLYFLIKLFKLSFTGEPHMMTVSI